MTESELRVLMAETARSLFARGYSCGSLGDLSVRCATRFLVTASGVSFATTTPDGIALINEQGRTLGAAKPAKEYPFHLAIYRAQTEAGGIVHLQAPYCLALSCLRDLDVENALPPFTPDFALRIGRLPVVPYLPPDDPNLAGVIEKHVRNGPAVLVRNLGVITWGMTLEQATNFAEEIEQQAKLFFLLRGAGRPLDAAEIEAIRSRNRR